MPRYSNIVFLFLLFTASPANAADEQGRYAIHGAGLLKCRVFVEEKSKQSPAYMMIGGWMDGYPITPKGLNFYADSDNRDTKEVNAKLEKPVNFLANWCQNKGIRRGVSGAYLL